MSNEYARCSPTDISQFFFFFLSSFFSYSLEENREDRKIPGVNRLSSVLLARGASREEIACVRG